ncbi:cytochrome P450 [Kribbella flavida DSM 17836]|uniref:Cytochrome P450 n=1 Tax=Kribbella flavida (strain DSM 17836 / JCM 10339 / NBRC 14399) TaxID=479435 RepID=D2PSN0_KRIFD|nr:cytochrome P450 [Kribbella flavida]ADB33168.1 cytochrome P450 [Kribbella flavida DSM 17836]
MRMEPYADDSSGTAIDLYPADFYSTGAPHSAWRRLRAEAPVWRQVAPDGTPFWSVTRYDDVLGVLRDVEHFTSEHSTMLSVLHGDPEAGKAINLIDGRGHRGLRTSGMRHLSVSRVRDREPIVRPLMSELVDTMAGQGEVDLVRELAVMPMLLAADIIGLPARHWRDLARWTMASVAPDDPTLMQGSGAQTLMLAHLELLTCFSELLAERRAQPADDLVSALGAVELDGRPLTDEEVVINVYAFTMGAAITTPQVIHHLALVMASQPSLWKRVTASGDADRLLDEALRWATPTNHLLRLVTQDTVLAGQPVSAGDLVAAWVGSANRDESVFEDPFRFDPWREHNPHLAFGFGPHFCIGAHAARIGLKLLVEELMKRVVRFELTGPARHLASNFVNGVVHLPVVLHAR